MEEKLDVNERKRQESRLLALAQSEVWRRDVRPWLMDRMTASRAMVFTPEMPEERDEGVAVMGTIEMFLEFVEGIEWKKRWERHPALSEKEIVRAGLLSRIKNKIKLPKKR